MRRAFAVLAVLAGLLSGCSADESDDAEPRADEPSHAAATTDGSASAEVVPAPHTDAWLPVG